MKRLPWRVRLLGDLLRGLYYRRVDVIGTPCRDRPTLFLLSHRNGAIDGFVYQKALGGTPSLVSVQLLRGVLRLLFDGIPVVRDRDRERYGLRADAVPSPINAAIAQLRAGGSLALYPEGTSAWDCRPLPYQRGMVVIAAKLRAAGVDFAVQPAAAHYSKPDGLRSRVSIVFGEAFTPQGESLAALQDELAAALAAVSPDCADAATFNHVQQAAWQAAQQGEDYGVAFLRAQKHPPAPPFTYTSSAQVYVNKAAFALGCPFIAAGALIAARAADGRNNVTFFRCLGGLAGALLQIPLWGAALCYTPAVGLLWLAAAALGWYFYPEPVPVPLPENP
ncbi:MAG: hypothetical protein ACFN9G_04425 [Cardiobacterium sp.]